MEGGLSQPLQSYLDLDCVEELYVTNNFKILKSCSSLQVLHLKVSEMKGLDF